MNTPQSSSSRVKPTFLKVRPATARVMSALALVALHAWFLLKFFLVEPRPELQVAVGLCGLVGMLSAVFVFVTRYTFQAHASQGDIDERELLQRNAAYFRTHQYMIVMVLVGLLVMEFWERATGLTISAGQLGNFLSVLFFSGLIMPATILAWQDRSDEAPEED